MRRTYVKSISFDLQSFSPAISILILVLTVSCSGLPEPKITDRIPGNSFLVWAHSDIQPRSGAEMVHYEIAVRDVADNVPGVNMAVVAGDIVHRRDAAHAYYRWFLDTRSKAGIPYWYEIAGNHDANDYRSYFRYTGKPLHYSVRVGNILFIFMSDEIRSASTDISDDVFNWWKRLVRNNRDRIIVTVTHGCLRESGLLATVNRTMTIRRSERFSKVLEKYPVDLWLSGHSHIPHYFPRKWSRPGRFGGTLFLDISAIRRDRWNTVESYFLEFTTTGAEVSIVPRDHVARRFMMAYALRHPLRHPFMWDGASPELIPYGNE